MPERSERNGYKYESLSNLKGKVVHICIKYSPCLICHRALVSYEKFGVEFEIITPENQRSQKKYSEIDKVIKEKNYVNKKPDCLLTKEYGYEFCLSYEKYQTTQYRYCPETC